MKTGNKATSFATRLEQNIVVHAVRNGLTNMIPVLIIGAFSLILQKFPVTAYQTFITSFLGGFLQQLFDLVYGATFGVLSVYMTYSISRAYMRIKANPNVVERGAVISSLLAFFILVGANLQTFGTESTGPKSMFLAILTALGASSLYTLFSRHLFKCRRHYLLTTGADRNFNRMLSTLAPITLVAIIFALFNATTCRIFGVDSFRSLLILAFNKLFSIGGMGFFKGFFFVLLSSVLWFFGIHGSDTLEGVMQTYFAPGLAANQAAAAAGGAPTTVLTKEFFDCFVLMGGCGVTICLLITILLFSRNHARRELGFTSAFPMIFNINEMMVFGLPIILNPIMLIPFLLVPLACYSTSYLAIATGLVPMITSEVAWTTPILLGGYTATGSIAGSLLQLFNVVLGVLIYLPFVRLLDKRSAQSAKRDFDSFIDFFKKNEQELSTERLIDRKDIYGNYAKALCSEIREGLSRYLIMAYQPQYNYDGRCIGVEALMRWKHPVHGVLYPPLVVKLAQEGGFLPDLEEMVLTASLREMPRVRERFGADVTLSVNVTGVTVVTPRYLQFCRQLNSTSPFKGQNVCIEITEQAALSFGEETLSALRELHDMGLSLAIDDFSAGNSSLQYFKDNLFDHVKVDGSLVRGICENRNAREIVSSIVQLASSLNLMVLAEFVETEAQRDALHEIGCDCYQGYLYSPAVFLNEHKK